MPYLGATTLADTLADLRSQATLPDSGAGLLSTLRRPEAAVDRRVGRVRGERRRPRPDRRSADARR